MDALEFLQAASHDLLVLSREIGGDLVIFETAMDIWSMQTAQIMFGDPPAGETSGLSGRPPAVSTKP